MPRAKRKTGTRKSSILQRHQRQAKNARLTTALRRFGISTGLAIFFMWAGAWLYLSGSVARAEAALVQSFYKVSAAHGFAVQDVLVEGRKNADPDVLLGLLDIERGDPVFAFDPAKARQNIERVAWIESVRVERRLPGVIYVALTERQPFALWQNQGKLRLIDSHGVVISDVEKEMARFRNLPLIVGEGAPEQARALFDLMNAEPAITERLEAAIYVGERRWDLKMKNSVSVRLPEADLALALRRLADAQERDSLLDKDVESIDLREENRIIIGVKSGAVQDYKASFRTGSAI